MKTMTRPINPVSSALLGGALVAMAIQATKPPVPPPCDINKQALDAIENQNKSLFESNKDLRDALSKLPEDKQKFIDDQIKAQSKARELDEKIAEAEKAKRDAERAEQAAKDKPCQPASKPTSGNNSGGDGGLGLVSKSLIAKPLPRWKTETVEHPPVNIYGGPTFARINDGVIGKPNLIQTPVPKTVWLFGSGVAVLAVLKFRAGV